MRQSGHWWRWGREQGLFADAIYNKGEVSAYAGSIENRKDLTLQGYVAHKKPPPPRSLQYAYAWGPMVVLGCGRFLVNEVPL